MFTVYIRSIIKRHTQGLHLTFLQRYYSRNFLGKDN